MSGPPRPGTRHVNQAKRLLNIDYAAREIADEFDLRAATAFALLALAEAVGDIALTLRAQQPDDIATPLPTPKETTTP